MSSQISEVKSLDDEPEEGEIQDDEELEDVSSDDEISSVAKRDSILYSPSFLHHKSSKIKMPSLLPSPRSDIFHGPQKGDLVSQFVPKRSRSGVRNVRHDNYYESSQRYKSFKDHHSKGRVHEKENKARETKKLYKNTAFRNTSVELRGGYPGGEHGETQVSSTSSKVPWRKSTLKEKHKKKKKSKSNKNYPLGEVHESQRISEKSTDILNVVKSSMEIKGDPSFFDKDIEHQKDHPEPDKAPSPTTSEIEILEVPIKVPEVITIGDSDDDFHSLKQVSEHSEVNVTDNLSRDDCVNSDVPVERVKHVCENIYSPDIDEYLLREAALNSSKSHHSSNVNPDDEVLQLRLAALRSAIIRKHEDRKKRGITLTKRDKEKQVLSISPLSSPNHCSEDSFVRVKNVAVPLPSSEEFNGVCDPRGGENDSEDKIASVDMELESEEERELHSAQSEDSSGRVIEKITENDNEYCKVSDDSMNAVGNRLIYSVQEVLTPNVSHSVPTSCSMAAPFQMESVECSSGYIIGDHDQQAELDGEFLPSMSFPFESLPGTDGLHVVVGKEQNRIRLSPLESGFVEKCDQDSDKETKTEEVHFQEESSNQQSPTIIPADCFDFENDKSGHHKSFDLLFRQAVVSDESDSASTGELDLNSMIVLDEVGRCSDDNKSESSIVEMVRSVKELCCSDVSDIHVTPMSCDVNSRERFVESPCIDKSISQSSSENILAHSESSGTCDENVCVQNCNVKKICNTESDFQNANKQLKSDLSNGGAEIELLELKGLKGVGLCDKSIVTSGICENEDFKMVSVSDELLNSAAPSCGSNSDGSCVNDKAVKFPFKAPEVGDDASIFPSCKIVQLPADLNGANGPCEAISCSPCISELDKNKDMPFDSSKLQLVNKITDSTCKIKHISVEEDEELLRLSLLAMLSKRSVESIQRNETNDLSQSNKGEELKTFSTQDGGCDVGCVENSTLESYVNQGSSLTLANVSSGAKEIEKNLPQKRVLPVKSSPNMENYQHRLNFSLKTSYSSRKRLCSINKRGAKSNKNRMLTNNTSRPNVNVVPELVINLGEDSDSGDELTVGEKQKVVLGDCVSNLCESKVVPPDFEKKLDLLLKQARFEQETNTSEEKDEDSGNNLELKSVNCTGDLGKSILAEESSKSLRKCAQSGSLTSNLNRDLLFSKASSVSCSLNKEPDNSVGKSGVTAKDKKLKILNLVETSKQSSRPNAWKTITSDTKKSVASVSCVNHPALSLVDIGLLPSSKQKEYIRLKKQLAQLVGRNDDKPKDKVLLEKISDNKPKRENPKLTSLKINAVKNALVSPSDKSSSNRKLMKKIQIGSQALRNDLAKARRLVRTVPGGSTLHTQVPGRLSTSAFNKLASLPERQVFSSTQEKLFNVSSTMKKITPVFKSSDSAQRKESPVGTSLLSTLQTVESRETRELLQNNVEKVTISGGGNGKKSHSMKSSGVKRKKSVSDSCEIVHKLTKSISQSNSGQTCDVLNVSYVADAHSEAAVSMNKKVDNELTSSNFSDSNTDDSRSETTGHVDKKLAEELWSSEQKLMARRYQVLEDICSVRMNLHDIKRINASKQHILRDIKSLKEKLSFEESKLYRSEELLNSLYSKVEKTKRNIMRGQSETLLLSVECEEKGCKVHGSDYNVPSMCTDLIRNGMLNVSQELQDIQDGKNCEELVCEMPTLCTPSEGVPRVKQDCITDLMVDTNVEELRRNVQSLYSSPLDAVRTESSSDIQAVLCPYHIMGSCKDKECSYLH